jgi:hypothetical protein
MPNITFDPQSFIVDGQRIWLVSGSIHYPRVPHELWRSRIRAAKQAGLNCIDTCVFWNVHEPQPGRFRFDGDADLRRFVELIGAERMYCILRPGPYVGAEWDFGGLPAWLAEVPDIAYRQANPAFLQSAARYLDAVLNQMRDLQVTRGGPIILVQNEAQWLCHNDEQAAGYLDEITRYLRESGCDVPLLSDNNMWQHVPNTIDGWNGWDGLEADARQLRLVQPDAPRLITTLRCGSFDAWSQQRAQTRSAQRVGRMLAEVAACGAQYNLYMFHGGTNFAFRAGRSPGGPDTHHTTRHDHDAPLREAGGRGAKYHQVKRISTFLTQFSSVMAHLDPDDQPTVARGDGVVSVWQQAGSMGTAVFLTRREPGRPRCVELLTPRGQTLSVDMDRDAAAWVLLDASLDGVARLDATNLRPWAFVDRRMLVLFGPAGSDAVVSIDDAVLAATVPTGATPAVEHHQDLTIVILNTRQVDAAYLHEDGRLFVGIDGFDDDGRPIRGAAASYTIVEPDGSTERHRFGPAPRLTAPRLGDWHYAGQEQYVTGAAPRFAAIDGPRSLEACGADHGYGWYRVSFKRSAAKRGRIIAPRAADRLHLFIDGSLQHVLGDGPGADSGPIDLAMTRGENEWVFLADNLGRFSGGNMLGEHKGIFGQLYAVRQVRTGKLAHAIAPSPDPFALGGWVHGMRRGDRTLRSRYTWTITHRRKAPLILESRGPRPLTLVMVNDTPIALDDGDHAPHRVVLEQGEALRAGRNVITLAALGPEPDGFDANRCFCLYEGAETVTADADWSYARWRMPDDDDFQPMPRQVRALPTWFGTSFTVKSTDVALWLDITGMSKGQIYLNGHNVGRYFVATRTGRKVPPQTRYYLPEPWLSVDEPNELILFDEHGRRPDKCKLVYDRLGP